MAVFQNAITGFNVNIPRRGKSYHVQTEDSGVNNPHIITHLFIGGNILATVKTSYGDIVGSPDLTARVRAMMEDQHKAMIRDLLNGKYDEKAAGSVQLHAPKVDMLTPYQEPVRLPKKEAKEVKPTTEKPSSPNVASKDASTEATKPVPETKAAKVTPAKIAPAKEAPPPPAAQAVAPPVEEEILPTVPPEEALQRAVEAYFVASQVLFEEPSQSSNV